MINLIQEAIKAGFQCDSEKSFASAIITTIQIPEQAVPYSDPILAKTLWKFKVDVGIQPYPNPLTYGGYFQSLVVDEKPQMQERMKMIETEFALYRQIGMIKISITNEEGGLIPKQLSLLR